MPAPQALDDPRVEAPNAPQVATHTYVHTPQVPQEAPNVSPNDTPSATRTDLDGGDPSVGAINPSSSLPESPPSSSPNRQGRRPRDRINYRETRDYHRSRDREGSQDTLSHASASQGSHLDSGH